MAQVNDSQPAKPVITFRVNLDLSIKSGGPYRTSLDGNETSTEASAIANTRSTFIPGLLGGENLQLKHGDTFTMKGAKAHYLKQQYVTGDPDDILQIVSES